ncbi:TraB/GumN family protein [Pseudomonas sp. HK3]
MTFITRTLSFFILLTFLISHSYADTSVWKVSKGAHYFYIGGTIHVLNKEDHPLPKAFETAYQDADTLIFETDLEAGNKATHQAKLMAAMTYSDARTLASELKPKIYKELENFLASRQIPIAHFAKYQPWGVSLMITLMEYQRLGMLSDYGVDNYFNKKGITDKKSISSLETFDEQVSFLQSLADIDPNVNIEYTLRDIQSMPAFILAMKKAWRSGAIEDFTNMKPVKEMKTDFPQIYKTLISNRNNNWMSQIPAFINDKDKEFVLVGTLHLNGEDGLLNQLKNQGFTVESF